MLQRLLSIALLAALCLCGSSVAAPSATAALAFPAIAAAAPVQSVILIGWDGAQREHVQQCLKRGELPNLAALGQAGALVDIDVTETTDTKAGWAQILTGYSAKLTGVYSNMKFQPIPPGYSIFERLEQHYGADGIATLAVIGKDAHVGNFAPQRIALNAAGDAPAAGLKKGKGARKAWRQKMKQGQVVEDGGQKYLEIPGGPYYITAQHMDLFENGLHENDKVGARALEALEQYKGQRFFLFVHFADVDTKGHKFGENSDEYTAALIDDDAWLGRIEAKLAELGLAGSTLVYVTADHGFDEALRTHKDAPYVFLASNDPSLRVPAGGAGNRSDITPTILARLGLDLSAYEPPLTGRPLR